jgi:hypothetical protein
MHNLEIYSIQTLNEFVLIEEYHQENNDVDIVDIQLILYVHMNRLFVRHYSDYLYHHLNDKYFVNKKHLKIIEFLFG